MRSSILLTSPSVFTASVRRVCLVAGCVSLLATVGGCAPAPDPPTSLTATPVPSVTVARVEERLVLVEQSYVGTVSPVRISTVGSPVEDRVVECLFDEGDFIKANRGDGVLPLVRLRTEPAELKLAAAEAELQVCEHKLEELKLSAPKEIEQAEARKSAAEALMEFTRSNLERAGELHEKLAISSEEFEERRSAAVGAQSVYRERKAAYELASSGLWAEKITQAEAGVEVQKQTISQLKDDLAQREIFAPFDGYVTEKHVEVGQWLAEGDPIAEVVELDDVYVEVPVSQDYVSQLRQPLFLFHLAPGFQNDLEEGVLSKELQQEFERHGIVFAANNAEDDRDDVAITTEKKGSRWQIARHRGQSSGLREEHSYTVIQREALDVCRSGTAARIAIRTFPDRVFHGEVVAVVPKANLRSRSFPVKVRLKNPDNPADSDHLLFKPGMFVRVTLPVGRKTRLLVPKDSLVLGGASPTVWVAEPESGDKILGPGQVKRMAVEVELRASDRRWIEILGPVDGNGSLPIEPGELVIVEGNERLIPGRPVKIVELWH